MAISGKWRAWFPIPTEDSGVKPGRWLLLEGDRYAVAAALLSITFAAILVIGTIWTFEIQRLLTETAAVQTILNTFLSGIILLVSIVVSINSIFLSYDIASLHSQINRVEATMEFRREIGQLVDFEQNSTDLNTFLTLMAEIIHQRARELEDAPEGIDEKTAKEIKEHTASIVETAEYLERSLDRVGGAELDVLWAGLEMDYGPIMDRSSNVTTTYDGVLAEGVEEEYRNLMHAVKLFVTGREYFKTLYYSREISELSRTLLIISLPSIIITSSTILAINANLLPDLWVFGLPPLMTFVAATFAIALTPFIVLTAYMLRVATVALRTSAAGPFVLRT